MFIKIGILWPMCFSPNPVCLREKMSKKFSPTRATQLHNRAIPVFDNGQYN
jgi:hypothetical protein